MGLVYGGFLGVVFLFVLLGLKWAGSLFMIVCDLPHCDGFILGGLAALCLDLCGIMLRRVFYARVLWRHALRNASGRNGGACDGVGRFNQWRIAFYDYGAPEETM